MLDVDRHQRSGTVRADDAEDFAKRLFFCPCCHFLTQDPAANEAAPIRTAFGFAKAIFPGGFWNEKGGIFFPCGNIRNLPAAPPFWQVCIPAYAVF